MKLPWWIKVVKQEYNKETKCMDITYTYHWLWIAFTYITIFPRVLFTHLKIKLWNYI